ncbi:trichohyalin isoform X1 [Megalobrama amblycephala]|uniref:trichohyalin isoform X1 n=1 Tax=Megalobrama amblycephala TaxID=75352 RepID=UPI0020147743|nr:trichohyalin isoform X1 [Megalobrama amblycephala]XP_048010053.1 trichohyalin isoform X1 [Megalobrama amblycephala]
MDKPREREGEVEPDAYNWTREREKFPATRRRDGEMDWRERERWRDGDRRANGKSSVLERAEYGGRDNERRKGDTFPRMTKPSREKDGRILGSDYKRERHIGRQKDILYENERENERRRYREMDTVSERESTRYREELKRNEMRRLVKEEPERQRERNKEFDSGMRERRRESYPGDNDLSGMRERETYRERDKLRQRDKEDRYYPRLMERDIESYSDRERRTERQREGERSRKRDTKSEGDSDGDRGKERKREEDAKHGHKLYKSEGDSDVERKVHRVRERDRRRDREAERRQDMVMPRERDYRETGYYDPKGGNLERLREMDKPRDRMRDSKDKRMDRDAYSYTTERGRYRDEERIRERDRYSEREIEERERRRREKRETERSKMEKSGQSSRELISGSDEQGRAMRENPEDRERENTSEIDKEKLTGRTEEEQEVKSALREEEGGERFAAEEAVTKKSRIRKMWLEPRSERKEPHFEEEYIQRKREKEKYIQRYKESKTTGYEEEPERKKENNKKSPEDKYRELEMAGEFVRDVEVEQEEKCMEGNVVCDREALETEWQMERENVPDNMEEEEQRKNNRYNYVGNEEGSEGESEAEKGRITSADDGFVTVSSGGDDAEEEDFEDCKEFWDGGVADDVSGNSGATQGREIRTDEELENQRANKRADRRAPKGPLKVFCVIAQTFPKTLTKQNAYEDTTVEEAGNQHSSQNVDNQGEMSTVNAFEKVEHSEQDIERAMDDLTLSPNEDKGEGTGIDDQAKEGVTSLEGQTILSHEESEQDTQLFPTQPSETLGPCHETHNEDTSQLGEKEVTEETVKHFDSDDTWSTSEDRKRSSTAPHLRWAKNVVKEILGLKLGDTENTRGTHMDIQTNTQTEGGKDIDKLRVEEELTEGGEREGGMERESSEEHYQLDPNSIQYTVSLEGEADRKVEEQVAKNKDSKKKVVLSSSSFQDLGNGARIRRRGFRKTEKTQEEEDEAEEEEEGEGVGRDRRTRIFNISDGEEDELSLTWSEMDLRKIGRTKKRNSKFYNSQLYQEYNEVAQNREILLSHTDSISISSDNHSIRSSSSPNHSPKLSHRPLPPLPQVLLHPHTLSQTNSLKSLNVPQQSIGRPPSPRVPISASSPTLWQELPGVRNSPDFEILAEDERRLQEVRFEVVTSEASYCRSLDIVVENFVMSKPLNVILSSQDKNWLFSRLIDVRATSHSFLSHLEETVENDIMHFTVCDVIIKHCTRFRKVYVPYLTNQSYQDKTYQRLMDESHEFRRVVEKLERNPVCQRLPLRSFLILPFQRITRLKLLVQNIVKRTASKTKDEAQAIKAMKLLEKMIQESNESISQMKNIESLVTLNAKVDFECRTLPLISQSRRLVREGSVTELRDFSLRDREDERSVYMHLFNDYLLLSLRKEGGRFTVIDHAPVSELRVENCRFKLHSLQKNLFRLHMSQKALLLKTDTQADKLRWISALSRPYPEIDFSAVQDFAQMQCIRAFVAQQPDELSLEKADVLLVHQQSSDGWVEGTRLSDRQRGWAPEAHLETIISDKTRKRNLLDTMRIATAAM